MSCSSRTVTQTKLDCWQYQHPRQPQVPVWYNVTHFAKYCPVLSHHPHSQNCSTVLLSISAHQKIYCVLPCTMPGNSTALNVKILMFQLFHHVMHTYCYQLYKPLSPCSCNLGIFHPIEHCQPCFHLSKHIPDFFLLLPLNYCFLASAIIFCQNLILKRCITSSSCCSRHGTLHCLMLINTDKLIVMI